METDTLNSSEVNAQVEGAILDLLKDVSPVNKHILDKIQNKTTN